MEQNVMVAFDGSEFSKLALKWYFENIHNKNNRVKVVYVAEIHLEASFTFRPGLAIQKERWEAMQIALKQKVDSIKDAIETLITAQPDHVRHTFHHIEGEPGHKLCKFAEEEKVGMIIIGSRGFGTTRRTVLGSVSDYVLHHAHCPVAIYHEHQLEQHGAYKPVRTEQGLSVQ